MIRRRQAAPDRDAGRGGASGGEAGGSAANGASGFRFVGMIVGLAVQLPGVVSAGFGSYGAAMSIYDQLLAPGRDVVYPKDIGHGHRVRNSRQQDN